jgi:hypothetical protein
VCELENRSDSFKDSQAAKVRGSLFEIFTPFLRVDARDAVARRAHDAAPLAGGLTRMTFGTEYDSAVGAASKSG